MGNEGLIIATTGIIVVTVAGVTYYLISKNKSTSGGGGGTGLTVLPKINATNTNFEISQGPFEQLTGTYSYSPSSFVLYGSGFTPNGGVVVSDNYSGIIYNGTADANGRFNTTIQLSSFKPTPGSSEITGIDLSTGLQSAPVTLTFTLSSSGGTGGGGTSPSTCTSGVAVGNWLTSIGINWYGTGCYQMPDGTYQYFSTESNLYNYAVSQGYITTSPSPSGSNTNPLGSQSNPYLFDNGYQGPGYYQFTSQEFTKLSSIPASGIKVNPTYMDNSAFYQGIQYWLSYSG